ATMESIAIPGCDACLFIVLVFLRVINLVANLVGFADLVTPAAARKLGHFGTDARACLHAILRLGEIFLRSLLFGKLGFGLGRRTRRQLTDRDGNSNAGSSASETQARQIQDIQ